MLCGVSTTVKWLIWAKNRVWKDKAGSCLAAVGSLRQQNHCFSLLEEPAPPASVPVTSELVWAEEV